MLPSLGSIDTILLSEDECINFLFASGILYESLRCDSCGGPMKKHERLHRCGKKNCRKAVSIFKDSFSSGRIKCNESLLIRYLWLCLAIHQPIVTITGHSPNTITDYIGYYRSLVSQSCQHEQAIIGGPDVIVEMDECKLGKRKYHRGHRVDGVWIVGGVERSEGKRIFIEPVTDRSSSTLLSVIQRNVAPGSIIYTDLWKGYSDIQRELDMVHMTVNHSLYFRDPETGVHTNTIEGTWNGLKLRMPARNRVQGIETHLFESIWRRQNGPALWNGLLTCLKETRYL